MIVVTAALPIPIVLATISVALGALAWLRMGDGGRAWYAYMMCSAAAGILTVFWLEAFGLGVESGGGPA